MSKYGIYTITIFTLLISVQNIPAENVENKPKSVFLQTPDGWRTEDIPFPISFAPQIKYEGLEEVRFAPGWMDKEKDTFFTYMFVWNIEGKQSIDSDTLQKHLLYYYTGLYKAVSQKDIADSSRFDVNLKKTEQPNIQNQWEGHIQWIEPFVTNKEVTLNAKISHSYCGSENRTRVTFYLSPQKPNHEVWKMFKGIKLTTCN